MLTMAPRALQVDLLRHKNRNRINTVDDSHAREVSKIRSCFLLLHTSTAEASPCPCRTAFATRAAPKGTIDIGEALPCNKLLAIPNVPVPGRISCEGGSIRECETTDEAQVLVSSLYAEERSLFLHDKAGERVR
jgi:hypothetical protein